jgi:hypothetical protein
MLDNLNNRTLGDRKPGRPSTVNPVETKEAVPIQLPDHVPAHLCPHCGRGMTPRILVRRNNGERQVECSLCGGRYNWVPAKIKM